MKHGILYKAMSCGECVYGQPYYDIYENTYKMRCITDNGEQHDIVIDENTISMFTGMSDKNGNRIFENDILQFEYLTDTGIFITVTGKVEYYSERASFYVICNNASDESIAEMPLETLDYITNIEGTINIEEDDVPEETRKLYLSDVNRYNGFVKID